jgi:hypothetical protein
MPAVTSSYKNATVSIVKLLLMLFSCKMMYQHSEACNVEADRCVVLEPTEHKSITTLHDLQVAYPAPAFSFFPKTKGTMYITCVHSVKKVRQVSGH